MPNPPRPLEMKRKLGNPGRRPLPAETTVHALEPAVDIPLPDTLGPAGVELWRRLQQAPWISEMELFAVEDLCQTVDEIAEYRADIMQMGITLEEPMIGPRGDVLGTRFVPNPLIRELRRAQKQMHSTASVLGFNPTARARLGLAEVRAMSKLEELLTKRNRRVSEHPSNPSGGDAP